MSTAVASNPVKQRFEVVKNFLTGDNVKKQIELALPRHIKPDHLIRVALTSIMRNPKLAECTQASLIQCLLDCAALGLDPGGPLGDAHLIPFNNRRANRVDCQMIVGYQGLVRLVRNTNELASVSAHVIYERDEFMVVLGDDERIVHKPYWGDDSDRGAMIGAYAIAKFKNGGIQRAIMTRAQIDGIMRRSKSSFKDDSPWKSDYDEMSKKTVLRRLCKLLPKSAELHKALEMDADRFADPISATMLELDDPDLLETTAGQGAIESDAAAKPQGKLGAFTEQLKTAPKTTPPPAAAKTETKVEPKPEPKPEAKTDPAKRTRKATPPKPAPEPEPEPEQGFFPDEEPEEEEIPGETEEEVVQEEPAYEEEESVGSGELASPEQLNIIDAAFEEMNYGKEKIEGYLENLSIKRFSDMTYDAAQVLIDTILLPRLERLRKDRA